MPQSLREETHYFHEKRPEPIKKKRDQNFKMCMKIIIFKTARNYFLLCKSKRKIMLNFKSIESHERLSVEHFSLSKVPFEDFLFLLEKM